MYYINTKNSFFYSILGIFMFLLNLATFSQPSQEWAARYTNGSTEQCKAMTVDGSGNVYVTGSSRSGGVFTEDIATIKYNTSGTQLWVKRYVGIGGGEDHGYAIATDASGNVYVTGRTWVSTGSNNDVVTIKYNSSGDTLWVKRYNGSRSNSDEGFAITVDASGNVYVTGMSQGLIGPNGIFDDLIALKYNSAGTELWGYRYNGPSGGLDKGNSIAVDGTGNIFITGTSWGGSGSAGTDFDFITTKLNSSGLPMWTNRYNGPGNDGDEGKKLSIDGSGYIYVTGYSYSISTNKDYTTIKYNSAGSEMWNSKYNGPDNDDDEAYSLAVDMTGNVYVTGKSDGGAATVFDIATVKYDSLGVQLWASRFNGSSSSNDEGKAIALDGSSNVYVAGYSTNPTTSQDYQTIKYNSSGVQMWEIKYTNSNSSGSSDMANSIFADISGNVYVAGSSALDYATVKYSSTVGISNNNNETPNKFSLSQNYPNPFNPTTNIGFRIANSGLVSLKVFDVKGQLVATLLNEEMNPGSYEINFDAGKLSSGVYFYKIDVWDASHSLSMTETKRMMLVK